MRGEFAIKDARPKKLAAPMYFDFGWQIYNSVRKSAFHTDVVSPSNGDGCICERYI